DLGIGSTDSHITIHAGPWTLQLMIDKNGRFPQVRNVIPKTADAKTVLRIDPEDAVLLAKSLPKLPAHEEMDSPITLDLGSSIIIRAKGSDQKRATELVLAKSRCTGIGVRLCCNRRYLLRALEMALSEIHIVDAETPLCCQDEKRTYIWMVLVKDSAL